MSEPVHISELIPGALEAFEKRIDAHEEETNKVEQEQVKVGTHVDR